jgi:hypothetical protein
MLLQALIISVAPHTLCYFVVVDRADNCSENARYISIARSTRSSLDVTDKQVPSNLWEWIHFEFSG